MTVVGCSWFTVFAGLIGSITACSNVLLQNDGFSEKLKAGCPDEPSCRRLQLEAEQRVSRCKDNTIGYVKCDEARADKLMADSLLENVEKAQRDAEEAGRKAELERERQLAREERDAQARKIDARRREQERKRLTADVERVRSIVTECEASVEARAARKRRAELLRGEAPAASVRKRCTPRTGVHSVAAECTDQNGFVRPCTKNVAGGIVGYDCPKNMDAELVHLGLYQLELIEYPFPEDNGIRVTDEACETSQVRFRALNAELDALLAGEAQK